MKTPDVLIVGAGLIGAFAAWELAREGLDVEIVDLATIGAGATAEGMGHLVIMDDSPAQFALTSFSLGLWHALAPLLPPSCDYSSCGTLWLAREEADLGMLREKATRYRQAGIEHEWLHAHELSQVETLLHPETVGALRVPGDALVYPPAVAETILQCAQRDHGVNVSLGRTVVQIEAEKNEASVLFSDGSRQRAGWILNAAGQAALDLLPDPLPGLTIRPRKGHLLITETSGEQSFCRHQLVEVGYLKSAHGHFSTSVAFNLQPRPNGQLLLGSSRQFDDLSRRIDRAILGRMVERALRFVPNLVRVRALRAWTGFRAATEDHLPILGPVPDHPRLLLSAGHEGLGITNAPASARLLADHLLGRDAAIPLQPYRADRVMNARQGEIHD